MRLDCEGEWSFWERVPKRVPKRVVSGTGQRECVRKQQPLCVHPACPLANVASSLQSRALSCRCAEARALGWWQWARGRISAWQKQPALSVERLVRAVSVGTPFDEVTKLVRRRCDWMRRQGLPRRCLQDVALARGCGVVSAQRVPGLVVDREARTCCADWAFRPEEPSAAPERRRRRRADA